MENNNSSFKRFMAIVEVLNVPKNQYSSYGKYSYRSAEDILMAVKPYLNEHNLILIIDDDIVNIGDRFYIKTVATIKDSDNKIIATAQAFAREPLIKKGFDEMQITGASSSYSKKYALGNLFCIDDNKDADTDTYKQLEKRVEKSSNELQKNIDTVKEVFNGEVVANFNLLLSDIETQLNQGKKIDPENNNAFNWIKDHIIKGTLPKNQEQKSMTKLKDILEGLK